jgi:hypothetical protein
VFEAKANNLSPITSNAGLLRRSYVKLDAWKSDAPGKDLNAKNAKEEDQRGRKEIFFSAIFAKNLCALCV